MLEDYINILDLCETSSGGLGPGKRYVIWVQGCPFNCKGCTTPEGIPFIKNNLIKTEQIASRIIANKKITGITISGGEPFMQASKLVNILKAVKKQRSELDVIIFSGFKLRELDWAEAYDLLNLTDVLIDGKYVETLNDNKGLRGSSNQRIHFLTSKLEKQKDYFEHRARNVEVHIYDKHQTIIGIPNKSLSI